MARHFLGLYLLVVLTLAIVSWGQDRLVQLYAPPDTAPEAALGLATRAVADRLVALPRADWNRALADLGERTGTALEVYATKDIAGDATLARLAAGQPAELRGADGETWALRALDPEHVLAIRAASPQASRGRLDWALTLGFYALIALALMLWLWPLTRDLRALERAAAAYGGGDWHPPQTIRRGSQIYPLADTFRRMATRIDQLIASHKHMAHAVSHEVKTPLSRMQFEIEHAREATSVAEVRQSLDHIRADIAALDGLVNATLNYALLERADVVLQIEAHDLTALVPAVCAQVGRERPALLVRAEVAAQATAVACDGRWIDSVLRNLLHNALRYAAREIVVRFDTADGMHRLQVDDDGPGVAPADRERVFDSFVQLDERRDRATGFGFGLAIVRRAIEWHGGRVRVLDSPLGGARFEAVWPVRAPAR